MKSWLVNIKKNLGCWISFLTLPLPTYGWGIGLRGVLYSLLLKKCGKNLKIAPQVNIYNPTRLVVGDHVYIGFSTYIGDGDITLEDEVVIGPFCSITAGNHRFKNESVRFGGYEYKPIIIGKGSWLGAHVCVVAGVTIGAGCLIAAGSVVTGDVPPNSVVAGVPGKVIRENFKG